MSKPSNKPLEEEKMKRTGLFIKPEQLEALAEIQRETGAPVSEIIRRAIDAYLQQRAKDAPRRVR